MDKTNVMRILEQKKISYSSYEYDNNLTDGVSVAKAVGKDCEKVFKTLVTVGNNLNHYVFVVPVEQSLDLKKAAKAVNVKSVQMIKQKELLPLTGYIHGGCSPIGMKKPFRTVIDEKALSQDTICVSAGKIGYQIELAPMDLQKITNCTFSSLILE